MLYLQPERNLLQHVIHAPDVYVVPRSSGKVLVGATVEDVGFDTTVEPRTIQKLLAAACKYLPELRSAPVVESWAGLRPGTPDDLPILGRGSTKRLFMATGHFRNGILLAPVTATIMAELITESAPSLDLSAFAFSRFATVNT
jgi:glycine oxidase